MFDPPKMGNLYSDHWKSEVFGAQNVWSFSGGRTTFLPKTQWSKVGNLVAMLISWKTYDFSKFGPEDHELLKRFFWVILVTVPGKIHLSKPSYIHVIFNLPTKNIQKLYLRGYGIFWGLVKDYSKIISLNWSDLTTGCLVLRYHQYQSKSTKSTNQILRVVGSIGSGDQIYLLTELLDIPRV